MKSPAAVLLFALLLTLTAPTIAQDEAPMTQYVYPFVQASGNRYLPDAAGTFPDVTAAQVQLDAVPRWVLGVAGEDGPAWVVVLDDGRVQFVQAVAAVDGVSAMTLPLDTLASADTPPALVFDGQFPRLLRPATDSTPLARFSYPVHVDAVPGALVYVGADGSLVSELDGEQVSAIAGAAIAEDSIPVVSGAQVAVYAGATADRYVHGIMGTSLEDARLLIARVGDDGALQITAEVELPGETVFEGLSPLWADVDGDGMAEIVTTVSDSRTGAAVRVYRADGSILAESDPIGLGFRWRHQLAVGPFGVNGEPEIANVRTPHIGGIAEFLIVNGERLAMSNAQLRYTSHIINSRNLDMGISGDFDGDGQPELVILTQPRTEVVGLANTAQGVTERWRLPLAGSLSTNLAAVPLRDGTLALAAGTDGRTLHIWR